MNLMYVRCFAEIGDVFPNPQVLKQFENKIFRGVQYVPNILHFHINVVVQITIEQQRVCEI